jgi:Holliday junction resolvase RusA-like endonuclease
MGKQVSTFKSSLPPYTSKAGYKWRRQIVSNLNQSKKRPRSGFLLRQKVEVVVLLYLGRRKNSEKQDVDNLLKHILDALQGRFGGPKSRRSKGRIIKNDRQVCRVVIE